MLQVHIYTTYCTYSWWLLNSINSLRCTVNSCEGKPPTHTGVHVTCSFNFSALHWLTLSPYNDHCEQLNNACLSLPREHVGSCDRWLTTASCTCTVYNNFYVWVHRVSYTKVVCTCTLYMYTVVCTYQLHVHVACSGVHVWSYTVINKFLQVIAKYIL